MKVEIEDYNIDKFREWLRQEKGEVDLDDDDLAIELNKFIELNLDLIF